MAELRSFDENTPIDEVLDALERNPHIVLEGRYRDVMPIRAESPLPTTYSPEGGEASEEAFVHRTAMLREPTRVKRT